MINFVIDYCDLIDQIDISGRCELKEELHEIHVLIVQIFQQ